MIRKLRIALPFVLLFAGAALFYFSPWPQILHLLLAGARVRVIYRWGTLAPLVGAVLCWVLAVALSLTIKSKA